MADKTKIEWTRGDDGSPGATWNPLVGCTKVSPGCDNCYAEAVVNRWHKAGASAFPGSFDTVEIRNDRFLTQPLRWTRPRRVFVNSLSDLFHQAVPVEFIAQVFAVMALSKRHTFQLLTKRHARMRAVLTSSDFREALAERTTDLIGSTPSSLRRRLQVGPVGPGAWSVTSSLDTGNLWAPPWPLPNVWLGVSVEDQHWADIRIPALLETPAAVRWLSAEPLLGPIDLTRGLLAALLRQGPAWVVVGGESGSNARPMHPGWARDLQQQCHQAGVPFLFKQWGNWVPVIEPRHGDRWVFGDGHGQDWKPGDQGAAPGRWDSHGDVVMRNVGKKAAGRELDGRTHDGYPTAVPA
jgi:protein gp37